MCPVGVHAQGCSVHTPGGCACLGACVAHMPPPPVNRMTDTCENIHLAPNFVLRAVKTSQEILFHLEHDSSL